jgi:hypothetical protein
MTMTGAALTCRCGVGAVFADTGGTWGWGCLGEDDRSGEEDRGDGQDGERQLQGLHGSSFRKVDHIKGPVLRYGVTPDVMPGCALCHGEENLRSDG